MAPIQYLTSLAAVSAFFFDFSASFCCFLRAFLERGFPSALKYRRFHNNMYNNIMQQVLESCRTAEKGSSTCWRRREGMQAHTARTDGEILVDTINRFVVL